MTIRKTTIAIAALIFPFVFSASANAALLSRLGGLAYYDDVADLTWLADAKAAGTQMNWDDANAWAAGLVVGGNGNWRLADSTTCFGYGCPDSEMGNLFFNVLGGSIGYSISTNHNANYDLFSNVQDNGYWSATEYAIDTDKAWRYAMYNGSQGFDDKSWDVYDAWAVQSGDVSAVPVPAAAWLFGSALLGLGAMKRRKT
jgi:hypothetical protein